MKKILRDIVKYMTFFFDGFKLIWRCSHKLTIIFILLNFILGLFSPILMFVWKYFIDAATDAISFGGKEHIVRVVCFLIIHCFIIILLDFLNQISNYFFEMQNAYLDKYITDKTMQKVSDLDLKHFDNSAIYDKIEKVNSESTQRTISLLSLLLSLIRSLTELVGAVIILCKLNFLFVLLCFFACIPMFIVNTRLSLKKYSLFDSRMEKMRLVYSLKYLLSKYDSIKEMKIFRLGGFIRSTAIGVYEKNIKEDISVRKKYLRDISIADIIQNIISYGFKFYILCEVILKNIYTLGDLTMFITAVESFQGSSQDALQAISNLYADGLYLENLFSLLEMDVKNKDGDQFNEEFNEIVFDDVWFKYPGGDKYVLKGINCRFAAKTSHCIVGLNGSGKTTIVKLLTKLYEPTKGKILVDGVDLREINAESYYKKIGVIFQDFIKYPFNVQQNIGVGNIEKIDDIDSIIQASKVAEADKFIKMLPNQYETILQKEWSEGVDLSLGQWQKIAISRAYFSNSSIIILDEPTASLDAEAEYELYKQFKTLMEGKLCVLISHRLSVNKLVDYIFYLEDGRVIEQGKHSDLLKSNGKYSKYYDMQASSYREEKNREGAS